MISDQSNQMPTKKVWYRQPWFIALGVLAVIWFGLPLVLNLFMPPLNINQSPSSKLDLPEAKVPVTQLQTTDDPLKGSPVAPIVIVEFGDFQCPFCRESAPIIKQLLAQYPEAIKLIYRDFPVSSSHPQAIAAAEAANCAHQQGSFWSYHDALFASQDSLGPDLYKTLAQSLRLDMTKFNNCLDKHLTLAEIQKDYAMGAAAGVTGTPTWFVNNYKLEGAITLDSWQKLIDYLIKATFTQP